MKYCSLLNKLVIKFDINSKRDSEHFLFCRQGTEMAVVQNKLGDTESQLENVKR